MNNNRERFIRLAENRVNSAIKTLRLIGNLSNKNNYQYDQNDVDAIFKSLEQELKAAKNRFNTNPKIKNNSFTLPK